MMMINNKQGGGKMGHTRTATFMVQVEMEPDVLALTGANTHREALKVIQDLCAYYGTEKGFIWPQTARGRRILGDILFQEVTINSDGYCNVLNKGVEDEV